MNCFLGRLHTLVIANSIDIAEMKALLLLGLLAIIMATSKGMFQLHTYVCTHMYISIIIVQIIICTFEVSTQIAMIYSILSSNTTINTASTATTMCCSQMF